MVSIAFSIVFAVVSIAHPIVFAMVLLLFDWFCNVFTPLSMVCNGFHCFSMVLLWSSLIFNAFAMFALLFQAFANHCATIGKSMKSKFSMGGGTPPGDVPPP